MARSPLILLVTFGLLLGQTSPAEDRTKEEAESLPVQDSVARAPFFRPKVVVHQEIVLPKDPFLAGSLSLILPGTGQAYCGKWWKGVGFILGWGIAQYALDNIKDSNLKPEVKRWGTFGFTLTSLFFRGWSVLDGVNTANAHNRQMLASP